MNYKYPLLGLFATALAACEPTNSSYGKWEQRPTESYLTLRHGIPAYNDTIIDYYINGSKILTVELKAPVTVAVADREYHWGYFQFPQIYRAIDNQIVVKWGMAEDHASSYGKHGYAWAASNDDGKTWVISDDKNLPPGGGFLLANGDRVRIDTPVAIDTTELKLPSRAGGSVGEAYGRTFSFYKHEDLPEKLQGVYLSRITNGETEWKAEHNKLIDPGAVRYTDNNLFPVVWWGDIQQTSAGALVAGVYPGFFLNDEGKVDPCGVLFYQSTDNGRSWSRLGQIAYEPELEHDPKGDQRYALGFTEPAFHILANGTYLCVMRTTDGLGYSPMYISYSNDQGKTWTKPKVFTSTGVLPKLLQLDNNVIALASGRPGMQIRFSSDESGNEWTEPFELFPFEDDNVPLEAARKWKTLSCGYPELLKIGKDRFLIVYSDFAHINEDGEERKAIKVREIIVNKAR